MAADLKVPFTIRDPYPHQASSKGLSKHQFQADLIWCNSTFKDF